MALLACTACAADSAGEGPAELILRGGRVYVRPVTIQAEPDDAPQTLWLVGGTAVACRGGRIAYVGDDKGAERFRGPASRVLDLHGAFVVPGEPAAAPPGRAPASATGGEEILEPGAPAEMTVFSDDPFGAGRKESAPPPVLYRVRGGELRPAFLDAPMG